MTSFVTKNGSLILKNGKLLVGDPSCCCCSTSACCFSIPTSGGGMYNVCTDNLTKEFCETCLYTCIKSIVVDGPDSVCPEGFEGPYDFSANIWECRSSEYPLTVEQCENKTGNTVAMELVYTYGACGTWNNCTTCEEKNCGWIIDPT